MIALSSVVSKFIILVAGVLYPSYYSYKAIKQKDVKEYVKWMIYWIVFSLFVSVEAVSDQFVTWLPFYYEVKILVILWLVSPASRGAIHFYKSSLHPLLSRREMEIDKLISWISGLGYVAFSHILSHVYNFVTAVFLKGQYAVLDQVKRRYNLKEVAESSVGRGTGSSSENSVGGGTGTPITEEVSRKNDSEEKKLSSTESRTSEKTKDAAPSIVSKTSPPSATHSTDRATISRSSAPTTGASSYMDKYIRPATVPSPQSPPSSYYDRYLSYKSSPSSRGSSSSSRPSYSSYAKSDKWESLIN